MPRDKKQIRIFPFNRVEGDLKVHLRIEDGVVRDAWCAGSMYRGFENIMKGRGPLDGLVITPRICGICTTAHLTAAARALDMVCGVRVPGNALRVRNVALLAEMIQNDVRHAVQLFMADFTRPGYEDHPLHGEARRRYEPMKGASALQAVSESRSLLEIIAILGGQWPHSSFMVPGGVVCLPSANDISQCRHLARHYRRWYEERVLGCSLERWSGVTSRAALKEWLAASGDHRKSELGFFIRFARTAGLHKIGGGRGHFIGFGGLVIPKDSEAAAPGRDGELFPPGFYRDGEAAPMDQKRITEAIDCSWFAGYRAPRHPFEGMTRPYAAGNENRQYTWAKAPRYDGLPAETGPLAQMLLAGDPLLTELIREEGPSVFARQLARIVRSSRTLPALETWLRELSRRQGLFYNDAPPLEQGRGFGLVEAPRGALGHWVVIDNGAIQSYQVITPTTWNASPRDRQGARGPMEEALVGTPVRDPDDPLEAELVVRSFDPCLVCTVH
jgi:uptake hydrogenase large subunit